MDVKDYWKNEKKSSWQYKEWYQNECFKAEANQGNTATSPQFRAPIVGLLGAAVTLVALAISITLL